MDKDRSKIFKVNKRSGRKSFEVKFYEGLLKKRPNFISALISLADIYTRQGFYSEGLNIDRKLCVLCPDDPIVHYNFACSLSLTGKTKEALDALKKATLLGYDDFSYILRDRDLENLRNSDEFKIFFSKLKKLKNGKQ